MGLIRKKILKKAEAMEKSIPELKAEIVCICVRQNKNNSFEVHIVIFKLYKKCKHLNEKGF